MREQIGSFDALVSGLLEALSESKQFRLGKPYSSIYGTSVNIFRSSPKFNLPLGSIIIRTYTDPIEYLLFRSMESAKAIEEKVIQFIKDAGLDLVFNIVTDL